MVEAWMVLRRALPSGRPGRAVYSRSMSTIPEPARPWRPEDGPEPEVWTWPYATVQLLRCGRRAVAVRAGHGAAKLGGRLGPLSGDGGPAREHADHGRTYRWSQPGLRAARGGDSELSLTRLADV